MPSLSNLEIWRLSDEDKVAHLMDMTPDELASYEHDAELFDENGDPDDKPSDEEILAELARDDDDTTGGNIPAFGERDYVAELAASIKAARLEPVVVNTAYVPPTRKLTFEGNPGGRVNSLNRIEVDMIRADPRTHIQVAAALGYSITTVMKVRGAGRFKGYAYVPRDEFRGRVKGESAIINAERPKGRPFKSGRAPLTHDETMALLDDPRTAREVAQSFGVSHGYVVKLWREAGLDRLNRGKNSDIDRIQAAQGSNEEIARVFGIAVEHVNRIRDGIDPLPVEVITDDTG